VEVVMREMAPHLLHLVLVPAARGFANAAVTMALFLP
jgi:hypothetical protein